MENRSEIKSCDGIIQPDCEWVHIPGKIKPMVCVPGKGGCKRAEFLKAGESAFHSAELIEATNAINKILANISEHPTASLSVLTLKQGLFLSWVEHGGEESEGGITSDSDPDVVAEHFNLI